jgi:hypothetical protein
VTGGIGLRGLIAGAAAVVTTAIIFISSSTTCISGAANHLITVDKSITMAIVIRAPPPQGEVPLPYRRSVWPWCHPFGIPPFSRCQFKGQDRPRISIGTGKSLKKCKLQLNTIGQNPIRGKDLNSSVCRAEDRPKYRPKSSDNPSIYFRMNGIESHNFGHFVAN